MDLDTEMPKCVRKDQKSPNIWFITNASQIKYCPKLNIVVASDASGSGFRAVILRKYDDWTYKPIVLAARSWIAAEKNYSQNEKEVLAINFAKKKFHKFLHGREFLLQTDHRPLFSIYGSKKGVPTHRANRLQRWGTIQLNYNYKVEFLPWMRLSHAAGLSRLIQKFGEPLEVTVIAAIKTENEIKYFLHNTIREFYIYIERERERAREREEERREERKRVREILTKKEREREKEWESVRER